MPQTNHPSLAEAAIRPATFADVDDIVAVWKVSAPLEESFHFRYQHAQQYPEDLTRHATLVHQLMVSPKYPDSHVMVAEAPSLEDVTVTKIVAYAVWDVSYRNKRQYGSQYKSQNAKADAIAQLGGVSACRHMNPVRNAAMGEAGGEAHKRLYDDVYGADNHVELVRLKTHPDYMRRGFASALVKWGINLAKEQHLAAVSVAASQMGSLLFAHLGFKHLEQVVFRAPGDTETPTVDLFVFELQDYKQQPEKNSVFASCEWFLTVDRPANVYSRRQMRDI